jgi:hypothetical protein
MSEKKDDDDAVGYGKPPKRTRFKKGQSGNPKGRPKGSKNRRSAIDEGGLRNIILSEAYRDISVKEEGQRMKVPVVRAIVRSITLKAAQGDHRSQQLTMRLLSEVERREKQLKDEWLKAAIEYKIFWDDELERRKHLGFTHLPEPLPHPDHIVIDFEKGKAHIVGPRTKEEKAAVDALLRNKQLLINELGEIRAAITATTDPRKRSELEELLLEKVEFACFLNKLAPPTNESEKRA